MLDGSNNSLLFETCFLLFSFLIVWIHLTLRSEIQEKILPTSKINEDQFFDHKPYVNQLFLYLNGVTKIPLADYFPSSYLNDYQIIPMNYFFLGTTLTNVPMDISRVIIFTEQDFPGLYKKSPEEFYPDTISNYVHQALDLDHLASNMIKIERFNSETVLLKNYQSNSITSVMGDVIAPDLCDYMIGQPITYWKRFFKFFFRFLLILLIFIDNFCFCRKHFNFYLQF